MAVIAMGAGRLSIVVIIVWGLLGICRIPGCGPLGTSNGTATPVGLTRRRRYLRIGTWSTRFILHSGLSSSFRRVVLTLVGASVWKSVFGLGALIIAGMKC